MVAGGSALNGAGVGSGGNPGLGAVQAEGARAIADAPGLTLGVLRADVLPPLARSLFPRARIVDLESYDDLPRHPEIDGETRATPRPRWNLIDNVFVPALRP